MKCYWTVAVLCAVVIARPSHAAGQSLAELARQEAARRQKVTPGKVITNDNLKPVPPASQAPAAPVPGTPPSQVPDKAPAASAGDPKGSVAEAPQADVAKAPSGEKKDEKYWRDRMTAARDNLARSQVLEKALQARIAALSTDFVNRDDPMQRAQIASDRQTALNELERVRKEILGYQKELTTIPEEARQAGVPAGWVR